MLDHEFVLGSGDATAPRRPASIAVKAFQNFGMKRNGETDQRIESVVFDP